MKSYLLISNTSLVFKSLHQVQSSISTNTGIEINTIKPRNCYRIL